MSKISLPPFKIVKVVAALSQTQDWGIKQNNIPNTWSVSEGEDIKILVDNFPDLKIIVSGSAAFELMSKVRESLAGRLIKLNLFPIAQLELSKIESRRETQEKSS
jgi:hypothetical protein